MPTPYAARDAVMLAFSAHMTNATAPTLNDTTQIAYDNVPFTPPTRLPWVRISMQHVALPAVEIHNKVFRREGLIFIQCFAPEEETPAMAGSDALMDKALDFLEGNRNYGDVTFFGVGASFVGAEAPWFRHDVRANFSYQHVRT